MFRGALHTELEMVERHTGEEPRGPFGQVLFTDTAEVAFDKTLLQFREVAAAAGGLARGSDSTSNALDQCYTRSGNAT